MSLINLALVVVWGVWVGTVGATLDIGIYWVLFVSTFGSGAITLLISNIVKLGNFSQNSGGTVRKLPQGLASVLIIWVIVAIIISFGIWHLGEWVFAML